jgi:predicted glutamine amidotransferase
MCGIWAILCKTKTGLFQRDVDIAMQMMTMSYMRGVHSTGVAVLPYKDYKQKPVIWKTLGGPQNLFEHQAWEKAAQGIAQDGGLMFGHARHATRGDKTVKNAHPFHKGHITMVHNGTIHSGLSYLPDNEEKVEVDSHALCIAMAKKGIKDALVDVHGAYAVIVHDAVDGSVYIARNDQRTLWMAENKDRVYIMSEEGALAYLMDRNSIKDVETFFFTPDTLYKYSTEDFEFETENLKEYKLKKYPPPPPPPPRTYNHIGGTGTKVRQREKIFVDPIEVTFTVLDIDKHPTNQRDWVYSGLTVNGSNEVVKFYAGEYDATLKNQTGTVKAHRLIYQGDNHYIFVRRKDIKWESRGSLPPDFQGDSDPITFKSVNGVEMSTVQWAGIVTRGCDMCTADILMSDAHSTYVRPKDLACLCNACIQEGKLGELDAPKVVH